LLHQWSNSRNHFTYGQAPKLEQMATTRNIVGPQIRKLRDQQGLTQEELAARCDINGFDLSRSTLAKIEAQLRCVTDSELLAIADSLRVPMNALFPAKGKKPQK